MNDMCAFPDSLVTNKQKANRNGMVFTQLSLHFITELILCEGLPHPVTHHLVTEITLVGIFVYHFFFTVLRSRAQEGEKSVRGKRNRTAYLCCLLTTSLSLAKLLEWMAFHSTLSFAPHAHPMNNILPDIFQKCLSDPCLAFLPAPTTPIPLRWAWWDSDPWSVILAPSLSPVTGMSLANFHCL